MVMAGTAAAGALALSNSAQCEANEHQGSNQQDMNEELPVYASSSDPIMVGGENEDLQAFYFVTSDYNNQGQAEDPASDLNKILATEAEILTQKYHPEQEQSLGVDTDKVEVT